MTEDERYDKLDQKLDKILEKLSEKLEDMGKTLQNHEVRIVVLERQPPPAAEAKDAKDWKAEAISMLIKALIIGGTVVASVLGIKTF
jgi:chromatin remodeling complex protein RSC6